MEIIYRADNGREFYDEDECREYEENLLLEAAGDNFVALDSDGQPISVQDSMFCDRVVYLKIDTSAALDCIISRFDRESMDRRGLDCPGVYVWGDDWGHSGWMEAAEIHDELKERVDEFDKMVEKLNK